MTNVQIEKQELFEQVIIKAWENSDFKSKLIANPVETIEELTKSKVLIPDGKTLVVLEESETLNRQPKKEETYLVIPENTYELTEEQLEAVAGGLTITIGWSEKDGWSVEISLSIL